MYPWHKKAVWSRKVEERPNGKCNRHLKFCTVDPPSGTQCGPDAKLECGRSHQSAGSNKGIHIS